MLVNGTPPLKHPLPAPTFPHQSFPIRTSQGRDVAQQQVVEKSFQLRSNASLPKLFLGLKFPSNTVYQLNYPPLKRQLISTPRLLQNLQAKVNVLLKEESMLQRSLNPTHFTYQDIDAKRLNNLPSYTLSKAQDIFSPFEMLTLQSIHHPVSSLFT